MTLFALLIRVGAGALALSLILGAAGDVFYNNDRLTRGLLTGWKVATAAAGLLLAAAVLAYVAA